MELLKLMKYRRSIRKYQDMQIPREDMETIIEALDAADAVVIGAGAGLSVSAGFTYSGERFERYFSDFADKYGFRDMYSGGFYPFPEPEEFWAYWSRTFSSIVIWMRRSLSTTIFLRC